MDESTRRHPQTSAWLSRLKHRSNSYHRAERERRAVELQREGRLEQSLAPFRVGSDSIPLNAAPLVRGIEDEITVATPAKLAEMLQKDELDAGLVSITEVLFSDRYDVLDGIAIASLGEVKSVLLAHRRPLEQAREIYCDTASLSSVNLVARVAVRTRIESAIQAAARPRRRRRTRFLCS